MSNIKLTKQDIEHLKKMQEEINSRGDTFKEDTIYQIGVDEFVHDNKLNECGNLIYIIDNDGDSYGVCEHNKDGIVKFLDYLIENYEAENTKNLVDYRQELIDGSDRDCVDDLEEEVDYFFTNYMGFSRFEFLTGNYERRYKNAFLTEFECKRHIEANRHHYNNPVVCENYVFRNNDLSSVLRLLSNINLDKLEISNE